MMFYENTVVTIVDGNKKPIRELESEKINNGRRCKVVLPFNSEYQFLVKNNCDTRIKVDIDIDGTTVTNDGLVVFQYQNFYLERFLNSPEKFKFVRRTHDKVSDPSNVENGVIKVKVYKEIKPYTPPQPIYKSVDYCRDSDTLYDYSETVGGCNYSSETLGCNNIVSSDSKCSFSPTYGSGSRSLYDSSPIIRNANYSPNNIGEAGATVGGARSNQQFTTTMWNGDHGVEAEFIFVLRGLDDGHAKKLQEYYKLKAELGI